MPPIKTIRLPLAENTNKSTHLEINTYYSLGGVSYATYKNEPRGYYISVTTIKLDNSRGYTMVTTTAFSGAKRCMIECSRQSKKKAEEACNIKREEYQDMIDYVLEKNGLTLA